MTKESIMKFQCTLCDYRTWEKRFIGLHIQYNHPEKMEEFLRVYDDDISEENWNKIQGVKK